MFKRIFFILIVSFSFLNAFNINKGSIEVVCEANNYSVSPNIGKHRYKLLLKNGKLYEALNLRDGKIIKKSDIYAYDDILKTIKKAKKLGKYKANIPNSYIFLDSIKKVSKQDLLYPKISRKKELRKKFLKWLKKGSSNYKAVIYDSRYEKLYPEGIEIYVRNNKIVSAKNARDSKSIDLNKKDFFTIRTLFGVVRWGLDNGAIVDYDRVYSYPEYIKLKNGLEFSVYSFKTL